MNAKIIGLSLRVADGDLLSIRMKKISASRQTRKQISAHGFHPNNHLT
jgi:hypothetical protein